MCAKSLRSTATRHPVSRSSRASLNMNTGKGEHTGVLNRQSSAVLAAMLFFTVVGKGAMLQGAVVDGHVMS